jgi:BMFP domain-containing protein YqiC
MQSQNRFLDDLARAASGALGAFGGLKAELDQQVRAITERFLRSQDLVTREEFEAVKEMAARARAEAEDLRARLDRMDAAAGHAVTGHAVTGHAATGQAVTGHAQGPAPAANDAAAPAPESQPPG